jgi:NTE family protein
MALGWDADTGARMATQLWTRELTQRPDRMALLRAAFPRLFGFDARWGLRDDALIMRRLEEVFGDRTFADATVPLFITATDFANGEQVVLRSGRLVDAIRASIAIPFAFRPHPVDGRLLVDGFLSDPLPVGVAIREGADVIVAVGFESPYQTRVTSAGRFAFQLSSIMTNNLLRASFSFHGLAHHSEVIPVIPRFAERVGLFETAKIPYVVGEGERAMEEQLPYLKRLLDKRLLDAAPAP